MPGLDSVTVMENQLEKNPENEMEHYISVIQGWIFDGHGILVFSAPNQDPYDWVGFTEFLS